MVTWVKDPIAKARRERVYRASWTRNKDWDALIDMIREGMSKPEDISLYEENGNIIGDVELVLASRAQTSEEWLSHIKKADKQNHPEARLAMALDCLMPDDSDSLFMVFDRLGSKNSPTTYTAEEAFGILQQFTEYKLPSVHYRIGKCLLDGIGTEPDLSAGIASLEKAAHYGSSEAVSTLIEIYRKDSDGYLAGDKRESDDYDVFEQEPFEVWRQRRWWQT